MAVPLNQALRVGAYVLKQHLLGRKRYPLVLMLVAHNTVFVLIADRQARPGIHSGAGGRHRVCDIATRPLGRSQVVRQRVLVP